MPLASLPRPTTFQKGKEIKEEILQKRKEYQDYTDLRQKQLMNKYLNFQQEMMEQELEIQRQLERDLYLEALKEKPVVKQKSANFKVFGKFQAQRKIKEQQEKEEIEKIQAIELKEKQKIANEKLKQTLQKQQQQQNIELLSPRNQQVNIQMLNEKNSSENQEDTNQLSAEELKQFIQIKRNLLSPQNIQQQ